MPLHFQFCANMPAVTNIFLGRGKSHGSIYELTILGGIKQWKYIYIYLYGHLDGITRK